MGIELFNEYIETFISHEGGLYIKLFGIMLWIVVITFFVVIYKSFGIIATIITMLSLLTFIELRMRTNKNFTRETVSLKDAMKQAKTGDLIFFRSFHTYDLPDLFFFRFLGACISSIYFGHVGLIVRMNKKVYIVECTDDVRFDELTKTKKNGPLINLAEPYIEKFYGRVHLCRTNLEEHFHRNHSKVVEYIESMKHLSFFENGLGCVGYVKGLLHAAGAMDTNNGFSVLASLLRDDKYKVPIRFYEPLLIRNRWQIKND